MYFRACQRGHTSVCYPTHLRACYSAELAACGSLQNTQPTAAIATQGHRPVDVAPSIVRVWYHLHWDFPRSVRSELDRVSFTRNRLQIMYMKLHMKGVMVGGVCVTAALVAVPLCHHSVAGSQVPTPPCIGLYGHGGQSIPVTQGARVTAMYTYPCDDRLPMYLQSLAHSSDSRISVLYSCIPHPQSTSLLSLLTPSGVR